MPGDDTCKWVGNVRHGSGIFIIVIVSQRARSADARHPHSIDTKYFHTHAAAVPFSADRFEARAILTQKTASSFDQPLLAIFKKSYVLLRKTNR
jgi:hypothetical protein